MKVYPKVAGSQGTTSPLTTAGVYGVHIGTYKQVRARLSAITSGSFSCTLNGTTAPDHIPVKNGNAADFQAQTVAGALTPLGYQQLTNLTSVGSLTPPPGARIASIQAEAGSIRYRDDGTAPTATVGMLINAGGGVDYNGSLSAVKLIAATTGAIANVSYYA
ncbi:hypothetical protein DIE15_19240 [Burkholderia sp. Bp9031]|uniref:hypothetical protein n=1 Tax=Burkholderia sp. Bp9031 TaxID=2184566 RepID=UPI000F5DCF4B|nr:hypothetical protein [Burkholderia sp. Bp9031]RQZ14051.1 hypothetical protein DIE15_19240 [Burkholderia sp. Bp9031]